MSHYTIDMAFKQLELHGSVETEISELIVDHLRERSRTGCFTLFSDRPQQNSDTSSDTEGDLICKHAFSFQGHRVRLPKYIDWNASPTGDDEWRWFLNRHRHWITLGEAY